MATIPTLRVNLVPLFPATVSGGAGISVTKLNGAFTIAWSLAGFSQIATVSDQTNTLLPLLNKATGLANSIAVTDFAVNIVAALPGAATAFAPFASAAPTIIIDGGGTGILPGMKGYIPVPFAATITGVTAYADQSGSFQISIYKCTAAQFDAGATHPVVGDSVVAAAPVKVTAGTKYSDTTLAGWTTAITAGDVLAFNVDSASGPARITVSLAITRHA